MDQHEYLLNWMKRHKNIRFTPAELREKVSADFKLKYGTAFGDPGRAARDLFAIRRIQRTARGKGQCYWYDSDRDSNLPLDFLNSEKNKRATAWKKFLGSGTEFDSENWELLLSLIENELSAKDRRELKARLASLLSRTKLNPIVE